MSATFSPPFPPLLALAGDEANPVPSRVLALPTLSDGTLLERVARGDADAFAVVYRRFERPVFAMLLRLAGGRRAIAEEWLQEAFTRVWLAAGTHDPLRGTVRAWIFRIALNVARSEFARKRSRTPHVSLEQAEMDPEDARAGEPQLAAGLDEARRARDLSSALERLPDFMREVVLLRCSSELSFAEIAAITGAPEGTLKSRFHRAVAALREALGRTGRSER